MDTTLNLLALMQLPGLGRKTILSLFRTQDEMMLDLKQLYDYISSIKEKDKRLSQINDIDFLEAVEKAKKINEISAKIGIEIVDIFSEHFPNNFKIIDDPPVLIFVKGSIACLNADKQVAIIGTRKPTDYGMKVAYRLGYRFAKLGHQIVSGLAIGCDTGAHNGAIDAKGSTLAVLPSGLDKIYPAANKKLGEKIISENGCLISEYPPESKLMKSNFIDRNRLQSALAQGIIVVESEVKSGTMHTVKFAEKYGKEVACYRHPEKYKDIEQISGNRLLLSKGALAITNMEGINEFMKRMDILKAADKNRLKAIIEEDKVSGQLEIDQYKENDGK